MHKLSDTRTGSEGFIAVVRSLGHWGNSRAALATSARRLGVVRSPLSISDWKPTTMALRALNITVIAGCIAALAAVACEVAVPVDANEDNIKGPNSSSSGSSGASSGDPGEPGNRTVETKTGLPCDVDAVVKKCQTCHSAQPQFGASTSLVTWEDLNKDHNGKKVFDLVKDRISNDARPMPPSPQPRLSDKEKKTFNDWVSGGAKKDGVTCNNTAPTDGVKPLSCKADTVLKAAKKFVMQPGSELDQYQCFGVDINLAKKRHVIGLAPKVDNKQIVHHILLFQTKTAESPEPFKCDAFGSAAWQLVAGWAPGGDNLELPKEAGFPEEQGTTHWVLQIHYNNANAKTGEDNSGYELCTTEDLRANDAGVLAFGSIKFNIPPRADHKIKCDYKLDAKFKDVKMFNASPHMHTRGMTMSTERLAGGNGTPEMVFDQKNFSFEAQANFPISKSVQPGDVMRTRCGWKNPGDQTIGFGEGTNDEMCFNFIGYYPKIPDRTLLGLPLFTWITPSQSATCTTE
jgi:hypothetical protein